MPSSLPRAAWADFRRTAGPLLAYLHERAGTRSVDVHQGVEIGRPSLLRCSLDAESGRVRVGGEVVLVAEGTVHL